MRRGDQRTNFLEWEAGVDSWHTRLRRRPRCLSHRRCPKHALDWVSAWALDWPSSSERWDWGSTERRRRSMCGRCAHDTRVVGRRRSGYSARCRRKSMSCAENGVDDFSRRFANEGRSTICDFQGRRRFVLQTMTWPATQRRESGRSATLDRLPEIRACPTRLLASAADCATGGSSFGRRRSPCP